MLPIAATLEAKDVRMGFLDGRRQRHVCSTKRDTNERRNTNGKDDEKAPWKGENVDRRVEARSEQSGARAWCLESPLRELRKGGLERERPNTRERNTANPYRLHDLESYR